jgi:hypothetical protein
LNHRQDAFGKTMADGKIVNSFTKPGLVRAEQTFQNIAASLQQNIAAAGGYRQTK